MFTLFHICIMVGWLVVMFNGVDSVGIDFEPVIDNGPYWTLFFMMIIVVCGFFILNLFVGSVISSFTTQKAKLGKDHMLTKR